MRDRATRIISWNVRSHDQRRPTIARLTSDIIMMQETKLKKTPEYSDNEFNVYFTPSKESGNAKRGLLTLIRKDIECCALSLPNQVASTEVQAEL